ncbi:MAG: phenol hydroxylase [Oceanospirillaceae bacterium]|nr:phenol hydroxylase [Oceanospirillaceae bacterium]
MNRNIPSHSDDSAPGAFDRLTKYIRVRSRPDERFVEFDFAIGDPDLFVELVLPRPAFDAFCRANAVVAMSADQEAAVDAQLERWRWGEDTLMSRNQNRYPG